MSRLAQLLAILLPCLTGCATLSTLQERAAEAQREAQALLELVEAVREECSTMDDPRPDVCQQADAVWEYVEATAARLGVR